MVERELSGQPSPPAGPPTEGVEPGDKVAAWRQRGAHHIDPVRFRFIEALARRAREQQGPARRILDAKLDKALSQYAERFAQAQGEARETLSRSAAKYPDTAGELERLFDAGDFGGLDRCVASLENHAGQSPLADLAAYIAQHASADQDGAAAANVGAPLRPSAELKSLRYFRNTWAKLSVEQQLALALAQGPENAGPLNSHLLVLRSLKLMRDISPDYLNRFMSYVDTLLWLEQADGGGMPVKTAKR